jgi:type II secretory pathway pseudopilin PulG
MNCRSLRRTAFTLVEVMTAMIITAIIGLSVASFLFATSYATSSKREVRRVVVRTYQARERLEESIRDARSVLAIGETGEQVRYLVLWLGDRFGSDPGRVNLSEIRLIEWSPATDTLTGVSAAGAPDPDPVYAPETDFYEAADAARDSGALTSSPWATGVSAFEIELDEPTPADARLVTWRMIIVDELLTESIAGTVSLREPGTFE